MPQIAFDLINTAEMEGLTDNLIAAAEDFRPNNKDLAALAEELGIVGTGQSRSALESVVKKSSKFVDVERFFETYGVRRGQVCRIEYPAPAGMEVWDRLPRRSRSGYDCAPRHRPSGRAEAQRR